MATVKSEVSHLRSLLGEVVFSRQYRLKARVEADHVQVLNALHRGDPRRWLSISHSSRPSN